MRPQCRQGYPPQCPGRLRGPGCLPATRPDRPGLSTRECSCACPPHLWGGAALRDAHLPPHPPQHRTVAVILGAALSTPRARRAQRPEWAKSSQHFGCQLSASRSSGVHGARPRDSKSTSWVLFETRENGERHLDRALGLLIAEQLPWHAHLLGGRWRGREERHSLRGGSASYLRRQFAVPRLPCIAANQRARVL